MVIVEARNFLKKIQFLGCYWAKRAKMARNDKINLSVALLISGTMHHMIVISLI